MKKLITLIIFLLLIPMSSLASAPLSGNTNTENSDIVATLDSGIYDKVIDVKLIPNDDWAKVFYYTDKVGRFDKQTEYKLGSTITIKKDTTLDYYSASRNETASLIKENTYTFDYPEKIHLWYNWTDLVITNNENKDIDLRWWTINENEILYPTILEISKKFNYPFNMNEWDIATLQSPDEKVKIAFKYLKEKKVEIRNTIEKEIPEKTISTENITSESISRNENTGTSNTEATWNTSEAINTWNIETSRDTINRVSTKENNTLNNNLKTSILDSKQEKKTNPLVLIIWIIMLLVIAWWLYVKLEKK